VADQHQAPVGADLRERVTSLLRVEGARQRRMLARALALLSAPLPGRDLGRLSGTGLGAEEHLLEGRSHARQGDARRFSLTLAARGEPAFGVWARPVRLGLGVT